MGPTYRRQTFGPISPETMKKKKCEKDYECSLPLIEKNLVRCDDL